MTYSPINVAAYTAAFSGAIAGMGVSGWITDQTSSDYEDVTLIAGAFAQAFDQVWNNAAQLNNLELSAITAIVQTDFSGRGPGPFNNPTFQDPNNWTKAAGACAALVLESDIFFTNEGINPGPTGPTAAFNQTNLAPATVGVAYSQHLSVSNAVGSESFAAVGLPSGLTIDNTGLISGTPTVVSSGIVIIQHTDSNGTISQGFSLAPGTYAEKVSGLLGDALIGYWQQNETSGVTAIDSSPTLDNGTYTNVTLNEPGIGDGQTSALYSASPISHTSIYSAKFAAAFNPSEYSIGVWIKVTDDTLWTDGNFETVIALGDAAGANFVRVQKGAGGTSNNGILALFNLGPSFGIEVACIGITTGDWHFVVYTFSISQSVAYAYLDGFVSQVNAAPLTPITGPIAAPNCNIGNPAANQAWKGFLAHVFVLNRVLTPFEVQQLARLDPGVWESRGSVLESVGQGADFMGEPNLLFDSNPQLLTGLTKVFKLWQTASNNGTQTGNRSVSYAESPDAENWSNYPGVVIDGSYRPFVTRALDGTYWLTAITEATGVIDLYKSNDGVHFGAPFFPGLVVSNPDPSAPDHYISGNTFLWIEGGTMYLFYDGLTVLTSPLHYHLMLQTSTDGGQSWQKYSGNPIQMSYGNPPTLQDVPCLSGLVKEDGLYYAWITVNVNNVFYTNMWRFVSPSLTGPWTQSCNHYTLEQYSEVVGLPSPSSSIGQLADLTGPVEGNGFTYVLLSGLPDQNSLHYELFKTPLTINQLVHTQEGMQALQSYEYLPNGSFESVNFTTPGLTQYWTNTDDDGQVSRTLVPSEVHKNTSRVVACKLIAGTNIDTKTTQLVLGLPPGKSYTLSGWSRGDGTNAGRIRVQNSTLTDLITWPTTLTVGTEYEFFSVTFIAPANGQVSVSCYCPAVARGTAYFDDLSILSGQNVNSLSI